MGVNFGPYAITNLDLDLDLDLDLERMFSFPAHIWEHAADGKRNLVQVRGEVQIEVQIQVCEGETA
jgi:hypothetical protein